MVRVRGIEQDARFSTRLDLFLRSRTLRPTFWAQVSRSAISDVSSGSPWISCRAAGRSVLFGRAAHSAGGMLLVAPPFGSDRLRPGTGLVVNERGLTVGARNGRVAYLSDAIVDVFNKLEGMVRLGRQSRRVVCCFASDSSSLLRHGSRVRPISGLAGVFTAWPLDTSAGRKAPREAPCDREYDARCDSFRGHG